MIKDVRGEILKALATPATVTELKRRTPNIKSFGSIGYHLKILEKEGIVVKKVDKTKRGYPTTYTLNSKEIIKDIKSYEKDLLEQKKYFLKIIKENPLIEMEALDLKMKRDGRGDVVFSDAKTDCLNEGLYILKHEITAAGEKFFKQQ
jgi:DNA-binding MarR family transcriptional regulator